MNNRKFIPVTIETTKRTVSSVLAFGEAYGQWGDDGILTIYTKHLFISAN